MQQTVVGNLPRDPEIRGGAVVFTIACSERRRRPDGEWQSTAPWFVKVSVFDAQAANVLASIRRGMRVMATGSIEAHIWTDANGVQRTETGMRAEEVAISVRFGPSKGA